MKCAKQANPSRQNVVEQLLEAGGMGYAKLGITVNEYGAYLGGVIKRSRIR